MRARGRAMGRGRVFCAASLSVAAAALAGCGPASLDSGAIVMGDPDAGAGADTGGPAASYDAGPCIPPAADPTLARFQTGVVGSWTGTATTPGTWTWTSASVEFTFFCDATARPGESHYHARCLSAVGVDPDPCSALYYGTDDDDPSKIYGINDVRSDGKATGDIVIYFGFPGDTTQDRLDAIDLAADGSALSFDLFHLDTYGPIHYELGRARLGAPN